jgi:hypothetical protein
MASPEKLSQASAEQRLVQAIIRGSAAAGNNNAAIKVILKESNIDWNLFKQLVICHQIIALAFAGLKNFTAFLPTALEGWLKINTYHIMRRSACFWREFLQILNSFNQQSIPIVPIKGISFLADIYQDNFCRQMVDIDLLVQQSDFFKAEKLLLESGFKKNLLGLREEYWHQDQYHMTFYKNNAGRKPIVELHWSVDYKRRGRHVLPEIWQRLQSIKCEGKDVRALSPEDSIFTLALHSRRFGENLSLKNVHDAALLMRKYESDFDWDYCLAMSEKYNMRVTLFFLLAQMELFSGFAMPRCVFEKLNVAAWRKRAIKRFILQNTFLMHKTNHHKSIYLRMHLLLYDSLWEPVALIFNIPKEQFAKYHGLHAYTRKSEILYYLRFFYSPFTIIKDLFIIKKEGL